MNDYVNFEGDKTIEPNPGQSGFVERSNWFRKSRESGEDYKPEGVTFVGPFRVRHILKTNYTNYLSV